MMMFPLQSTIGSFVVATFALVVAVAVEVHPRHCGGMVRHIHLAVGNDPSTSMTVSFASIPSQYTPPIAAVLFGLSPDQLDMAVFDAGDSPRSYNVTAIDKKKVEYVYHSPHYHHITITGLQPSTKYYYKPVVHAHHRDFEKYHLRKPEKSSKGVDTLDAWAREAEIQEEDGFRRLLNAPPYDGSKKECPPYDKIRSFTTAPKPSSSIVKPVTFAIMGDLGQFPHSQELIARLRRDKNEINAVVLAGDIAYTETDHRRWCTFFDFWDDYNFADSLPVQIVPGNHDIDKLKHGKEIFLAYEHRFRMPRVRPPQLGLYDGPDGPLDMEKPPYPLPYEWGNAYYAYSFGPARFVMISAYSSMEPDSEQYRWIVQELQTVNRSLFPWVIAVLHTPLYNTFSLHRHDTQMMAAQQHLEPLFVEYSVNFVFSGHIHAYLRTDTVAHGVVNATGPVHITVGSGGRKCEAPFASAEPEAWVKTRDATMFGYGMFKIHNRTHAQWDWIHTGFPEDHSENQVWHSDETLPAGPAIDQVYIENQYYIR